MKHTITLPIPELKTALAGLGKVVSRRAHLPILGCLRVTRDPAGQVSLQGTDLDSYATYHFSGLLPGEPLEFLIPMDQLAKTAKTTKDHLHLVIEDKTVTLRTFLGDTPIDQNVPYTDPHEMPPVPQFTAPPVALPDSARAAITQEAFQCASRDDTRYVLQSVFLDVTDSNAHYVVATNGRILYSANSFHFDLKQSVLIPTTPFLGWKGWWTQGQATLAVQTPAKKAAHAADINQGGYLQFTTGHWTYITKMVDGTYPNWRQCVPLEDNTLATIDLPEKALQAALDIIARLPGEDTPIFLRANGNTFQLQCRNKGQPPASIPVPDAIVQGKPTEICLDRTYLTQALRLGLTRIELLTSLNPAVFRAPGRKLIIMPLHMDSDEVKWASSVPAEPLTPPPSDTQEAPQTVAAVSDTPKGAPRDPNPQSPIPNPQSNIIPVQFNPLPAWRARLLRLQPKA